MFAHAGQRIAGVDLLDARFDTVADQFLFGQSADQILHAGHTLHRLLHAQRWFELHTNDKLFDLLFRKQGKTKQAHAEKSRKHDRAHHAERQKGPLHQTANEAGKTVGHAFKTLVHAFAQLRWRLLAFGLAELCQACRQQEKGLQQTDRQADDYQKGDLPDELAHHPGHEHHRDEGGHRGQEAAQNWNHKFGGAFGSRFDRGITLLVITVNVFGDDDAVVDDHAEGNDQTHHRDHVEGHVVDREGDHCAQDHQWQGSRRHDGGPEIEKNDQHDHNQRKPEGGVGLDHIKASAGLAGLVQSD